nr:MAG TPA: hypothetical protein [Caudoviricetes sp.]
MQRGLFYHTCRQNAILFLRNFEFFAVFGPVKPAE